MTAFFKTLLLDRIEQQAQERARQEHENEKRDLQNKMDAELAELQAQLKLFQKVTNI